MRGDPATVYSDRGTNLTKLPPMWKKRILITGVRIRFVWRFTPPGCQFRDGLAESRVKMMKKTLVHLTAGGDLNYAEYECVLARAANVINEQP